MKTFSNNIKKGLHFLFFDPELVEQIKKSKIEHERLYNYLSQGRITLEEYVHAINKTQSN